MIDWSLQDWTGRCHETRPQEHMDDGRCQRRATVTKETGVSVGDDAHRTSVQSRYTMSRNTGTRQQSAPSRRAETHRASSSSENTEETGEKMMYYSVKYGQFLLDCWPHSLTPWTQPNNTNNFISTTIMITRLFLNKRNSCQRRGEKTIWIPARKTTDRCPESRKRIGCAVITSTASSHITISRKLCLRWSAGNYGDSCSENHTSLPRMQKVFWLWCLLDGDVCASNRPLLQ